MEELQPIQDKASTKTCRQCQAQFTVASEDLAFYRKVSPQFGGSSYEIPAPTLCPDCRQQRRLVWRGEKKFYRRPCDKCGTPLITIFYPDSTYTVYCRDCWWGDGWNATDSGRDYDFSRPFFAQFEELMKATPLLFSWNISSENSDFNNNVSYLKNCYLLSSSNRDEDCYFGYYFNDCKDSLDGNSVKQSELTYECIECVGCYNLKYSKNCTNCSDSWFLENCLGCKHCFGCFDLRQKEYCYFNEQLTKEQYEAKLAAFRSGSRKETAAMLEQVRAHHLQYPQKYMVGENNEDVTGNMVHRSKNAYHCFDCVDVEDCAFCYQMQEAKECRDCMTWGRPGELLYECQAVGSNAYLNRFLNVSQDSRDNCYGYLVMFSKNTFGCVGPKHAEYLILNKQYTKEEYEALVPKIIEHMKSTGEWGEFFPMSLSPFAYNEALSNDWLPIPKDRVLALGAKWREPDPRDYQPQTYQVPDDSANVTDAILEETLACRVCHKNFKLIPHELAFYKTHKLPIPERCPECRHELRMARRNPRHLWERQCMCQKAGHNHAGQCPTKFETSFAPDRPEIVYCESCYQKEVV